MDSYKTQDLLFASLRDQQSINLASALLCDEVQGFIKQEVDKYLAEELSSTSLILSYRHGKKLMRVEKGHCPRALNKIKSLLRSARSARKSAYDIPLFDEELLSALVTQTKMVFINPDFLVRIQAMAKVIFDQQAPGGFLSLMAYHRGGSRFRGKASTKKSGPDYLTSLASASFFESSIFEKTAVNQLVEINQKLVMSVSKPYLSKGIDEDTIISAGNLGLYRAIRRYNPELGTKISTTAVPWIKQMILEEFPKQSTISLPYRMAAKASRAKRLIAENPEYNAIDVAEHLNITTCEAETLLVSHSACTSLDSIFEDDSYDKFFTSDTASVEETVDKTKVVSIIDDILKDYLDAESELLVRSAMGLDGAYDSLKEASKALGLTMKKSNALFQNALDTLRENMGKEAQYELMMAI